MAVICWHNLVIHIRWTSKLVKLLTLNKNNAGNLKCIKNGKRKLLSCELKWIKLSPATIEFKMKFFCDIENWNTLVLQSSRENAIFRARESHRYFVGGRISWILDEENAFGHVKKTNLIRKIHCTCSSQNFNLRYLKNQI